MSNTKLAVVLVRGMIGISPDVRKTLELLKLQKKHACVVVEDNEVSRGMLQRVKDYVTYGSISEAAYTELLEKRGEMIGKAKVADSKDVDVKKIVKEFFAGELKNRDFETKYNIKSYFRLHPPKGGFEKKGIKMPFTMGGVLGNRGDKMETLISKML